MSLDSSRAVLSSGDELHKRATRKAVLRLLPVMCVVYFMAYIDRTNVALAKTHLDTDVGISAAAFGFGAGIFFISYAFLEVPSNLVMYRVGPRRWIARIALTWGALSALMMFVQGDMSFYVMRFLLGAAEAGLYPALMYMVTLWFAQSYRATVVGFIYLAPTIALVVGGPMGGALMELDSAMGLHGWQWMFLIEGLVTMLVGVLVWFKLPQSPTEAKWLTPDEARILSERAAGAHHETVTHLRGNLGKAFGRPFVIVVALIYFFNQITNVGIVFNIPAIVEDLDISGSFVIGLLSGSAGIGATIGVLVVPRLFAWYQREAAAVGILAAATLVTSVLFMLSTSAFARIILIAISMIFVFGTLPLFWSIAMARMSGLVAAASLAFINTIGLIGGFVGPYLFGLAETATHNPSAGFYIVIVSSVIGVALAPVLAHAIRREDSTA
ncbi:MFS transporter [Mycolicibacterium smegmatis]|uniref:Major facilitator superfamily MFS_1 n=3 Tax=Mycolicibacterium smegmatis TaxID=1772 RepID=I7FJZ0_MYCS2|nr:MFS transporter [Mycolicibacterium smegmatis]ABK75406.1 transporter, major facilitator family protein [Mycolicibacterium smegmatis MC2 155]AFP41645.1 Major facilitator superfamily MFS_1 [Mycolicibacterium smegmatis MC2 155]AIU10374.1 major facilitator transporter [Mycolicibacterium smegmatis MC2 155]AIU16999.1 major facilitator transporter [Mycolicibacterium smegmatis]AIU23622.1 major facilitator transporter [Mycolicibacterium smegmatis]